jgi:hypothetical protein
MIDLIADKITIRGPAVDGSYKVTFDAGEYQQVNVAELLKIPQGTTIKVKVDYDQK